ncbi:MAG: hypothetical protein SFX74_01540 [Fimbriimonadaceae bacterium]|nr:hypothetical protein [Fimbriimonadaceae bacterium]
MSENRRIWVRGVTGAGKSTLAAQLERELGIPRFELDDLHHLPGWQVRSAAEFRALVEEFAAADTWITSGNYSPIEAILVPRVTEMVWLDYGRWLTFARLVRRTVHRVRSQSPCCNGNTESWQRTFSRDSILLWHWRTYAKRRAQARSAPRNPDYAGIRQIVLRSPRETARWLGAGAPSTWPR